MSKYFDVLVNGKHQRTFNNTRELEAIKLFEKLAKENPEVVTKLVLHRRTEIQVSKNGHIKIRGTANE